MRIKSILSWGFLFAVIIMAAGIASCSNPDQRPRDTFFAAFPDPLQISPVGVVFTDPVFRVVEPDSLIEEQYLAANLHPMTSSDMWGYFTGATQSIELVCTRISNPNTVAMLVGIANRGIEVNIITEQGYFTKPEFAPFIAQLTQAGNVTIKTDHDGEVRQVHSRYAIIDDHIVLSSSGDFLDNSFNLSINNTLIFDTPRTYVNGAGAAGVQTITDAFAFDFDQMFNMNRFGGDKERLINHTFNIGVLVELYFGPNDNFLAEVLNKFSNSQGLQYAVAQITDPTMGAIAGSGYGFTDDSYGWTGFNAMNHKFMLINVPTDVTVTLDPVIMNLLDPVVITGSANWTYNGLYTNDEQLVVVHDLTLGFEFGIEIGALERGAAGVGVVFGTVRTFKNVPISEAVPYCDSNAIPGSIVFIGDQGVKPEDVATDARGMYLMFIPTGFLRNISLVDLGSANGLYLFPDPLWGPTDPNSGWVLLPGSSYEANFYLYPMPTGTGTGS
jgi:hypothetical protein